MSSAAEAVRTDAAPAPVGPYNQAVKAGAMVGNGDVEVETRQVLANLQAVLAAAGTSPAQVVRTTVFLVDLADFTLVNGLYSELFDGAVAPARACVQVAALPKGARVEIDAIALLG
jgi:2-iminobutanoate/2-iminopropanoate deaminase